MEKFVDIFIRIQIYLGKNIYFMCKQANTIKLFDLYNIFVFNFTRVNFINQDRFSSVNVLLLFWS